MNAIAVEMYRGPFCEVGGELAVIPSKIPSETDAADRKYGKAVATLVYNCGGMRVRKLLESNEQFTPKKVRVLAGTSVEYQRYVIDRAFAGDRNPFKKTAASVSTYETVGFYEVISRLERALGQLRHETAYLKSIGQQTAAEIPSLKDHLAILWLLAGSAQELELALTCLEVQAEGPTPSPTVAEDHARSPKPQVHAAGALGFVAKNLRNVPLLKEEHRPTTPQKTRALIHCQAISREATATFTQARRKWGPIDEACRVTPRQKPTRRIITHAAPDADAVVGSWLAEQFLFSGEPVEVLFVPRGRVLGAMRKGDCLVDVGNTHDPVNLWFDHKPPACANRHDSCAARLVWDRLIELGKPVGHLQNLVNVVFAGDSTRERPKFKEEYAESRRVGVHKVLTDAKATEQSDADVYRTVCRWLNAYHKRTEIAS